MNKKHGVKINSKKPIAFLTLVLFMFQCLPLMTFGATGKATVIKGGNTPTAPTNVKASLHISGNTKYVTITWSPSKESEKGIAQYRVYRNGKSLGSTVNLSYTDRTVQEQEKYQYKIVGIGNNGRESRPGVSNTVNLVQKQTVINAKTGEKTLKDFKTPLVYKEVKSAQTGGISYVLKPATLKTSLNSSLNLKSVSTNNKYKLNFNSTSSKLKSSNLKLSNLKSSNLKSSNLKLSNLKSSNLKLSNLKSSNLKLSNKTKSTNLSSAISVKINSPSSSKPNLPKYYKLYKLQF